MQPCDDLGSITVILDFQLQTFKELGWFYYSIIIEI